jgi:hypothetical protein
MPFIIGIIVTQLRQLDRMECIFKLVNIVLKLRIIEQMGNYWDHTALPLHAIDLLVISVQGNPVLILTLRILCLMMSQYCSVLCMSLAPHHIL